MRKQVRRFVFSTISVLAAAGLSGPSAFGETRYVSPDGANIPPYTNLTDAARQIQSAVNVASAGDTILVAAGTYDSGTSVTPGNALQNRLVVTNAILISAVDGPESTIIVGEKGASSVRCAYLSGGARLENFTFMGGSTISNSSVAWDCNGGGVLLTQWAQISNCIVRDCVATEGGGVYILWQGNAFDSLVFSNRATHSGGGVRFSDAGSSTVHRCWIKQNWGRSGGGAHIYHAGRLENCLIADNVSTQEGSGVFVDWGNYSSPYHAEIINCTIAGNYCGAATKNEAVAYVISGADVRNSIIYGNTPANWSGGNYQFTCTTPAPSGPGNISADPLFADADYRLSSSSPCINSGTNAWARGPADLDGNARIDGSSIDIGAYEYTSAGSQTISEPEVPTGPSTNFLNTPAAYQASGSTCTGDGPVEYRFDWGDDSYSEWTPAGIATHTWSSAGTRYVSAQARCATNASVVSGWSAAKPVEILDPTPPSPTTHYVAPGGGDISPYTNWAMAAHRIQDAINVAASGGRVIVSNGLYMGGIDFGSKELEVRSLYDDTGNRDIIDQTVIDAGGTGRVVSIQGGQTAASRLSGFTIQGGRAVGKSYPGGYGAGIGCFYTGPRLEHLVVRDNHADGEGAGMYFAHATALITDVRLEDNTSESCGGGMRSSYGSLTFRDIVAISNAAPSGGALFFYHTPATIRNALIVDNVATGEGGGAMYFDGSSPTFENVTMRGNKATGDGEGGALNVSYQSRPVFRNCIFWGNQPQQIHFNADWSGMNITLDHCDVQGGTGAIVTLGKGPVYWQSSMDSDPLFAGDGDSRLQGGSPCKDAGTNQAWMASAADLDGNPRIIDDLVDLGAYEYADTPGVTVSTPMVPQGLVSALAASPVEFTTGGSTCSDASAPQYRFDWGDGTLSGWSSSSAASHAWAAVGAYDVRAQARSSDNPGAVSVWSATARIDIVAPPPTTHYVAPGGGDISPYTNWAMAAHRIQDAINVAASGGRVIVSNGLYMGGIDFGSKELEVRSLYDDTGDRDIIDQTVIDAGGTGRVVSIQGGQTAASRLSGFTIQGGRAVGKSYPGGYGAGIGCFYTGPRLEHLIVRDNHADGEGAGMYFAHATALITDVRLEDNTSESCGGGMRSSYGSLTFRDIVAISNAAPSGGALFFYHTPATIRNALIVDNVATGEGGGAMYFDGSSPTFENVTMRGNKATGDGEGGALNVSYQSRPVFRNCIFWGNQPQQIHFNADWFGMNITLDHCDVQGGTGAIVTLGKGPVYWQSSMDSDPLFAGDGDSRLQGGSPCKDAGTNQAWMASAADLDGNPRIIDDLVDLGAYEYTPAPSLRGSITCVILPADVRPLGARWRIVSGIQTEWLASGDTVGNLDAGNYGVEFDNLAGWVAPSPQLVSVSAGVISQIAGTYEPILQDYTPPAIISIFPWDGYVTSSNKLWMTIVATDNTAVASVSVNGRAAENTAPQLWMYQAKPLNGHYHLQEIVAVDVFGNRTTQSLWYAQSVKVRLTAIWNGYWRVRNPFDEDLPYLWYVKENPAENGSGFCPAHRDDYFYTSLGSKHVVLTDTNGTIIDEKGWSPAEPPDVAMHAAFVDSDLDGLLNMDEDIAGSDPENSDSRFEFVMDQGGFEPDTVRIGGIQTYARRSSDGDAFVYAWLTSSNSLYTIESSTNLVQWTAMPGYTDVEGSGSVMSYTNNRQGRIFFIRLKAGRSP